MIPLKFFRDKTHVYVNNPDGTTKKMTIADFEDMLNGSGGDLPEYSSSDHGKVLSVDSDGDLDWISLPNADTSVMVIGFKENESLDKNWEEIMTAMKTKAVLIAEYDLNDETSTLVVQEAYIDETTNKYTVVGYRSTATKVYNSDTSTGDLFVFEG